MTSNPEQKPFSLVMIDLDEFKKLNDELGHLEGDRILKEVAGLIKQNVRDSDIVARYGGDEFALILPGVGHDLNNTIIERLRTSIIGMGYFTAIKPVLGIAYFTWYLFIKELIDMNSKS